MHYSYKSNTPHNFKTITLRHLPRFIWPIVLFGILQLFYPDTKIVKDSWHLYIMIIGEIIALFFAVTDDSINEIIIDTSAQKAHFHYYNLYQGNMEKYLPFSVLNIVMDGKTGRDISKIDFLKNKTQAYTLTKNKDNFTQHDINDLASLLHSITTPKTV